MIFASRARMPSPPLPVLIATGRAAPSTNLHQPAGVADQVGAFLDRGAVSGGARRGVRAWDQFGRVVGFGLWWRGENPGGQPVERFVQRCLEGRALARPAGIGQARTVDAAPQRMLAQHHLGMLGEIAVHPDDGRIAALSASVRVVTRVPDLGEVDPCRARRSLAVRAALEHQQIDHDLGARARAHAAFGQTHRAHQIGHAGDVLACRGARLVHGAGAGDEQRDAARTQPRDRAGDEVIMQPQTQGSRDGIGPHHAIGEGRVADREIEAPGQIASRVILAPHQRLGMHQARDAGGDRIVFDAGELAGAAQRLRQQREEQAGAHAGFQHAAPGKAQPFGGSPESTDDRLRRVVRVLRRALQRGVFRRRDGGFERRADLVPLGPEFRFAGAAESSSAPVPSRRNR